MKALEILKNCRKRGQKRAGGIDLDEAITELEDAIKPKSCDGCIYEDKDGVLNVECAFCLRNSNDNFKPKDTQCG